MRIDAIWKGNTLKKTLLRVASVLMTLLLIGFGLHIAGDLLLPDQIHEAYYTIEAFHELPKNSVDVMVYGSSHAWKCFAVNELQDAYGISAFNYGCNWQHVNTTRLFVYDSYRSQSPKVAVIETFFVNNIREDVDLNGEILYTRKIPFSRVKAQYLKQCFGNNPERYATYAVPLMAFHSDWEYMDIWNFKDHVDKEEFVENRGYWKMEYTNATTIPDWHGFSEEPLSEGALAILQDIVNKCHEEGTEVVFYTAPYGDEYKYCNAMAEFSEEMGCAYVNGFDLWQEIGIDPSTDYFDYEHLNASGAAKMADYIGEFICENYDIY